MSSSIFFVQYSLYFDLCDEYFRSAFYSCTLHNNLFLHTCIQYASKHLLVYNYLCVCVVYSCTYLSPRNGMWYRLESSLLKRNKMIRLQNSKVLLLLIYLSRFFCFYSIILFGSEISSCKSEIRCLEGLLIFKDHEGIFWASKTRTK